MEKIHLIMPMGGGGTRFGNKGFHVPKPLIILQGKPFFYWATQSIVKYIDVADITFVVLKEHIDQYEIDKKIREFYPQAIIQVIPQVLNGAVLTCCEGIKAIQDNLPILFNDCDHAFRSEAFEKFCHKAEFQQVDGALLTFESDSPNYSYVKFNAEHEVIGTIEKQVVSREAICGAYYFKNKEVFSSAVDLYLKECQYKEFFVSGVYNVMTRCNNRIITFPVEEHISFGTPEEYDTASTDERVRNLD